VRWVIAVGGFGPRRRTPGSDDVVRTSVKCGSCQTPIGIGEVYALVTAARLKRCADCAMAMLHAAWDARGWCPWPLRLDVDATTRTDAVDVDFQERLRAAFERSQVRRAAA
jgi:hypothetical protein